MDGTGSYTYEVSGVSNYDGDSCRCTIRKRWDFGFHIHVTQSYAIAARIKGVDTPELRDKRPEWKAAAQLAKAATAQWLEANADHLRFVSMDKPDKYGRALGDFLNADTGETLSEHLINGLLGVLYQGQNKDLVEQAHQANIAYLIDVGLIAAAP